MGNSVVVVVVVQSPTQAQLRPSRILWDWVRFTAQLIDESMGNVSAIPTQP
jgi:hypothetical protein